MGEVVGAVYILELKKWVIDLKRLRNLRNISLEYVCIWCEKAFCVSFYTSISQSHSLSYSFPLSSSISHSLFFFEPQSLCVKFGGILSESRWGFWVNIVAALSGAYFNLWFVKQGGKTLSPSSCDSSARPAWTFLIFFFCNYCLY